MKIMNVHLAFKSYIAIKIVMALKRTDKTSLQGLHIICGIFLHLKTFLEVDKLCRMETSLIVMIHRASPCFLKLFPGWILIFSLIETYGRNSESCPFLQWCIFIKQATVFNSVVQGKDSLFPALWREGKSNRSDRRISMQNFISIK